MMDKAGIAPGLRAAYAARLNRVIDYIDRHLGEELNLDLLAGVAAFSKYHFHRIFYALLGETLADYILRQRLQKAAYLLLVNPRRSVTNIALDCGFSNPAVFAANFKTRFGTTATAWRKEKAGKESEAARARNEAARPARGGSGREPDMSAEYQAGRQRWTVKEGGRALTVEVAAVPAMTLAYVRYIGPYKGDAALFERLFRKLFAWLGPRNLVSPETSKTVVVYDEYPGITPDELLRMSVGCTVPAGTAGEGEVGVMDFSPGVCAVTRFVCASNEYQAAWDWVYRTWLPGSGFAPADCPAFERYDFDAHDPATGKTTVDVCVPVAPL